MAAKMDRVEITMTGRGAFPVDMLRYDSCFPASEHDAYLLAKTFTEHGDWAIRLAKWTASIQPWAYERWSSFNCYKVQNLKPSCYGCYMKTRMDDGETSVVRCRVHGRMTADAQGCELCEEHEPSVQDRFQGLKPGTMAWEAAKTAEIIANRRKLAKSR